MIYRISIHVNTENLTYFLNNAKGKPLADFPSLPLVSLYFFRLCFHPDGLQQCHCLPDLFFGQVRISHEHRGRSAALHGPNVIFRQAVHLDAHPGSLADGSLLRHISGETHQQMNPRPVAGHLADGGQLFHFLHEHIPLTLINGAHPVQMPLIIAAPQKFLQDPLVDAGYGGGNKADVLLIGLQQPLRQHL